MALSCWQHVYSAAILTLSCIIHSIKYFVTNYTSSTLPLVKAPQYYIINAGDIIAQTLGDHSLTVYMLQLQLAVMVHSIMVTIWHTDRIGQHCVCAWEGCYVQKVPFTILNLKLSTTVYLLTNILFVITTLRSRPVLYRDFPAKFDKEISVSPHDTVAVTISIISDCILQISEHIIKFVAWWYH